MRAIILAGGKGRRLEPYTVSFPKPLVPVADMPILEIVVRQLKAAGFTHLTLAVGHLAELLMAYFGDGSKWGLTIDYSREEKPLGTVAPLKLIDNLPERFLVMNGDVLTTLDYRTLLNQHESGDADLTIACHKVEAKIDLGVIETTPASESGGDDRRSRNVTGYREKPRLPYEVSMGVYVFNRGVLDTFDADIYMDLPSLVHRLIDGDGRVEVYRGDHTWLDIGRPEDYGKATEQFEAMRAQFLPEEVDSGTPEHRKNL